MQVQVMRDETEVEAVRTSFAFKSMLSAFCPQAAGSGIPQVKLAFWKDMGDIPFRVVWVKFIGFFTVSSLIVLFVFPLVARWFFRRIEGEKISHYIFVLTLVFIAAWLFEASGVESVDVETYTGTACFPSIRTMVEADLRGWLPVMGVVLPEEQIDSILNDAEGVLADYVTADGKVVFNSPAHIVSGMAGA